MKAIAALSALIAVATQACPFAHGQGEGRALRSVFEDVEVDDYQSQTAQQKFDYVRGKIDATPKSASWPNALELAGLFTESMSVTEDQVSDEFAQSLIFQRMKLIHSVGYIAEAKIQWLSNPYTGLFQGSDKAYIRFASAKEPDYSKSSALDGSFVPGFGMKVFRDGQPSGNIVALHSLGPQDSWNWFKYPMSNHLTVANLDSATSLLAKKFATAPSDWAGFLGLNSFAKIDQHGASVSAANLKFPFQLIFYPDAALQKAFPDTGAGHDLFTTQLSGLKAGQHLYSIYAKDTRTAAQQHIGEISLGSAFVPSSYADQTMFLQHTRFDDDIKLRPTFLDGCNTIDGCPVCPQEIAC